ncbi:hypothetical protein BC832DRAFT_553165 [Gaertneriomyces semiglobifer]|nr:hypothetical protein BC832DRAFT_553165 [Gaertneriomyces semiglobifer]
MHVSIVYTCLILISVLITCKARKGSFSSSLSINLLHSLPHFRRHSPHHFRNQPLHPHGNTGSAGRRCLMKFSILNRMLCFLRSATQSRSNMNRVMSPGKALITLGMRINIRTSMHRASNFFGALSL